MLLEAESTTPRASTTPDDRETYDHIWLEWVNEKITESEKSLERINQLMIEYKKKHTESLRKQIYNEVDYILVEVKKSLKGFDKELKKTGLNLLERYTLLKTESTGQTIIKLLTEVQKLVSKL